MKKLLVWGVVLVFLGLPLTQVFAAEELTCWFPPGWKNKPEKAQAITNLLSADTGLSIHPSIAESYPDILSAFATKEQNLVYVGSFVQAIINARGLGTALVQSQNGKELYSGIMIYPDGQDPQAILQNNPREIAFAVGASSGESTAKAATGGLAAIPTHSHSDSCLAVREGRARAAMVKNWWWEANKERFTGMSAYEIPAYSHRGNPDNVLTASNAVTKETRDKIIIAAMKNRGVFDANSVQLFEDGKLNFSLWLMKKGQIDPMTYTW